MLRCSIVHNKATELHFSRSNVSQYRDIVPLMKKIIRVMEEQIVNLIGCNDPNKRLLDYHSQTFNLY